jgi:hypothetical protein
VLAYFDRRGNDPAMWRAYARQLHGASVTLSALSIAALRAICAQKVELPGDLLGHSAPAAMLRGMACECYLKALGLQRGKFVLASGGRFNRRIPGLKNQHDLLRLARLVDFPLISPEEERALRDLSRAITAGRYPIQLHWSDEARLAPDGRIEVLSGTALDSVGEGILARLSARSGDTAATPAAL